MPAANMPSYRAKLWPLPAQPKRSRFKMRRMGVEIEFAGMSLQDIAQLTQELFGGKIDPRSDYEIFVRGTQLGSFQGDFGIELDFAYLKKLGRERDTEVGDLENLAEGALALVAKQLVPCEVVSPPIPMNEVWRMDTLVKTLRQAGAQGTRQAPLYAFGLHLNPELPNLEATTIVAHLQSFLGLFEWLQGRSQVDLSRRVTPYIDPFGKDYMKLVLDPDYQPSMDQLIDDYLEHNPTRNRALDMLPLFAHIDEDRVRAVVDDDRVKARPTFHYRLPNCQIDEPDWGLIRPWRDWLQIEALAHDRESLRVMCTAWQKHHGKLTGGLLKNWAAECPQWLLPELL